MKRRQKRREGRREEKAEEKRREEKKEVKVSARGQMGPKLPRHGLRNQRGLLTPVPRSRRPRVPDSGIDTGKTGGPSLTKVSWVPEDPRFVGGRNVDTSTPFLMGGPGLTSNGWVNVLRLQKERRCNQHPGWRQQPPAVWCRFLHRQGQTGEMIRFSPGSP